MDTGQELGMEFSHRLILLGMSAVFFLLILELVRREWLKERYAVLWLATAAFGLLVGMFPGVINLLSNLVHLQRVTTLAAVALIFTLAWLLYFCVVMSRLTERNRLLTQDFGVLNSVVRRMEEDHRKQKQRIEALVSADGHREENGEG